MISGIIKLSNRSSLTITSLANKLKQIFYIKQCFFIGNCTIIHLGTNGLNGRVFSFEKYCLNLLYSLRNLFLQKSINTNFWGQSWIFFIVNERKKYGKTLVLHYIIILFCSLRLCRKNKFCFWKGKAT